MVRKAFEGEKFHALDDKIYELNEGMTVITDEKEIVSLGGIIGGMKSAVSDKTKNVVRGRLFRPNINSINREKTSNKFRR